MGLLNLRVSWSGGTLTTPITLGIRLPRGLLLVRNRDRSPWPTVIGGSGEPLQRARGTTSRRRPTPTLIRRLAVDEGRTRGPPVGETFLRLIAESLAPLLRAKRFRRVQFPMGGQSRLKLEKVSGHCIIRSSNPLRVPRTP